ncbi:MAG: hypothetical protein Q9186_005555 [Xanthomendoza sp. 1 TL-2023]
MALLQTYLRPTLHPFRVSQLCTTAAAASYARFYSAAQAVATAEVNVDTTAKSSPSPMQARTEGLRNLGLDLYPRFSHDSTPKTWTAKSFLDHFATLESNKTVEDIIIRINGRVKSVRKFGSSLFFIDLVQDGQSVQGVCNVAIMSQSGLSATEFTDLFRRIQRGDVYSMSGKAHRTQGGQLSILVTELPELQSPCLHEMPTKLQDRETRIRNRHVDFRVNKRASQILLLRSRIIGRIRDFLQNKEYLEVQTPILANFAGGAVARPFQTRAVEFPIRHVELRTAPELWLKRLVLGGFENIFEIGPCFRNEGEKAHSPQFTTCEFYTAYTSLEKLISITEELISDLIAYTQRLVSRDFFAISPYTMHDGVPFRRLDFITSLEAAMDVVKFPDLRSSTAETEVIDMFRRHGIGLPDSPTLPRLLDRLSSKFIEPLCQEPTWIVHQPECLSPLSKSFDDPETKQRVSARAELFIAGKEVINTYEEENSPLEQRRKFEEQVKYRNDENRADIDESYLEALEWGLPPTGGWGCGIDRLVMLLSGTDRINDVLPFGNLRNVISLGRGG